jgi:hypothetical protein
MPSGPTLTFDKSFLQSINADESAWLDHFFACNITPLFFIETLANIEKEVHKGRTPEQIVGSLAEKTPDMNGLVNPFHLTLLESELMTGATFGMDGRMLKARGQAVTLNDQTGIIYKMSPEEEAFLRWQRREFLDLERQIAKAWRKSVTGIDHSAVYKAFGGMFDRIPKPKNLADAKRTAEGLIDRPAPETAFSFGMSLLNIGRQAQAYVMQRWAVAGKKPIAEFAPYFRHVLSVDLFFYLAIASDLISRVRPKGKADNMVDVSYAYYLPFCKIFTSSDTLHERIIPLFLREDQTFIKGTELKADLRKLDEYYDGFPEEKKGKGFYALAPHPPEDTSFLVTRLWDRYRPDWREEAKREELTPELQKALFELMKKIKDQSMPLPEGAPQPRGIVDIQYIHEERPIHRKKGKWTRVPPEAK